MKGDHRQIRCPRFLAKNPLLHCCLSWAAVLFMVCIFASVLVSPAKAAVPNVASGYGITVKYISWLSERTLIVGISTPAVGTKAVNGSHEVRITFPVGYFSNPNLYYPVLYLLHGGAGGSSRQWTSEGGAAEFITEGYPIITVMPDGGKVGWYTDWVQQGSVPQQWEQFHLDQLIPWADANFRTIARKSGRAIAGLSMGGFGAIHYAQERPDLFAIAGSFSGALDLEDQGIRTVIVEQCIQNGFSPKGPFGPVIWPFDTVWKQNNPLRRANDLRTVSVALYWGDGIHDADVLERTVGWSSYRMSQALAAAGIPHFAMDIGRPGPGAPFGADGGHNFSSWNFDLLDAVPRMVGILEKPQSRPSVGGAIGERWVSLGAEKGFLGWPVTGELTCPDGKGKYVEFEGGSICWTSWTGAWSIRGAIRDAWLRLGGPTRPLGYPVTDELQTPDGVGRCNHFEFGSIYWTPATGAHAVWGAIRDKWAQLGWEAGPSGHPTTDEMVCPDGIGRYNHFTGKGMPGSIYWAPSTGAHAVYGKIRERWAQEAGRPVGWAIP